jgi:hypothetical protein
MKFLEVIENIIMLISLFIILAFVGWIFWITRNPWSFMLFLIVPSLRRVKNSEDDL